MTPKLRRELLGFVAALAFLAIVAYGIHLVTSSLATLGIGWYWWLGFALFLAPFLVAASGRRKKPSPRYRPPREEDSGLAMFVVEVIHRDPDLEAQRWEKASIEEAADWFRSEAPVGEEYPEILEDLATHGRVEDVDEETGQITVVFRELEPAGVA